MNKVILPTTASKLVRVGAALGVGFAAAAFGMPSTGAGFTGGMMALTFQNGLMADDGEASFADEDSLADRPLFLDENDQPMVLEEGEDGTSGYRYLSDDEIQMLHENGAFEDYQIV